MPHYHKPHTDGWFAALQKANPQQAAHTLQIIKLAGSKEVCSVCGDKPASDYEILKMSFYPGVVATIRLCDDCHDLRKAGMQEDYKKLESKTYEQN